MKKLFVTTALLATTFIGAQDADVQVKKTCNCPHHVVNTDEEGEEQAPHVAQAEEESLPVCDGK